MSGNKWDPFRSIFKMHSSKSCSSMTPDSLNSTKWTNYVDELFAHIKESPNRFCKRRRNSIQIDWESEFDNIDVSISSVSSSDEQSIDNPFDYPMEGGFETTLSSIVSDKSANNGESSEHISTNISENPSNVSDFESQRLRRSQRQRIPVMESWRGQRPIYRRDSSGLTLKFVGIEEGIPYEVKPKIKSRKKRKNSSKSKSDKNIFNLSVHKKKKRVNTNNQNKEKLDIKSLEDLSWKPSGVSNGLDIAIMNKNKDKGEAVGMLRIKGNCGKNTTKTGDYRTYLTIVFGALALKIEDNEEQLVNTFYSFEIKSNTRYSLTNLRKDVAYISFTVFSN